jgi:hypothetical protein
MLHSVQNDRESGSLVGATFFEGTKQLSITSLNITKQLNSEKLYFLYTCTRKLVSI